ncbi:hypothetical protein E3J51_03815 [Candidatus Bathyarchaeota archaeon]|nr:MAG: hypothetical protein E3J51_03815 [Candidatus Bathyarchaeota archaeon]
MRRFNSKLILTLLVITIGTLGFNTPLILAEYRYVDLSTLATYEANFLGKEIITSGIYRSDFFFIPETSANAVLEDPSSQTILTMYISPFSAPLNGSIIIVHGLVDYDFWGGYCFYVQFWELGSYSWWNLADANQDLKVDMDDVVLCVSAYESTPSDPHWDPFCDIAEPHGIINIFDVVMMASNYGEEHNP